MDPSEEQPLVGGNVGPAVVRVGATVRRPSGFWSPAVDALLRHLHDVGYDGAPRSLGFDEWGRHVVEYVPGRVLMPFDPEDRPGALRQVGRRIRDLHDAVAGFVPPVGARWNVVIPPDAEDLVVHHDLAPWNLVGGGGGRWVFIDWDNAGPGSRLWDLAYAAHGFVPLAPATAPGDAARRLAHLAEGYGLDQQGREGLVDLLWRRAMSMYELLRDGHRNATTTWDRLWAEGHGAIWSADADYIATHLDTLRGHLTGSP